MNRGNEEGAFGVSGALLSSPEGWREADGFDSEASLLGAMLPGEEDRLTQARYPSGFLGLDEECAYFLEKSNSFNISSV